MRDYIFFLIAIFIAMVLIPTAKATSPDDLFSIKGFAWLDGGYENFVGTGIASDKDGETARIVFGGGNHASGNQGATFPWAKSQGYKLFAIGFNDMQIKINNKLFAYKKTFEKQPTNADVKPDLKIERLNNKIFSLSMDTQFKEIYSQENYNIRFVLNVVEGENVVVKREGMKKFDNKIIIDLLKTYFGINLDQSIGLLLTEHALKLDPTKSSYIEVSKVSTSDIKKYTFDTFIGGLEKSKINIYAIKNKNLSALMQYDYITLYPGNLQSSKVGVVAYISGILNHKQKISATRDSWIYKKFREAIHKFSRKNGSSAFFIDSDGNGKDIPDIQRYGQIKSLKDISKIKELDLVNPAKGVQYPEFTHKVGPGIFHRSLVEIEDNNGNTYYGMLETQSLVKE